MQVWAKRGHRKLCAWHAPQPRCQCCGFSELLIALTWSLIDFSFFSPSLSPHLLLLSFPTETVDTGCSGSIVSASRETTSRTSTSWAETCQRPSSLTIHRKPLHTRWTSDTKPDVVAMWCYQHTAVNVNQTRPSVWTDRVKMTYYTFSNASLMKSVSDLMDWYCNWGWGGWDKHWHFTSEEIYFPDDCKATAAL